MKFKNKVFLSLAALVVFSVPTSSKEIISSVKLSDHSCVRKEFAYEQFRGECTAFGFAISDKWIPYGMDEFAEMSYPSYDNKILQYQTDIQQIFLRYKDTTNVFGFIYRIVQSPQQPGRYGGFFGIGSYGDNWYARGVKTSITLRTGYTLTDWAPENSPSKTTTSIGVSGGDSGLGISAAISFDHSELEVISRTNVPVKHYETEYVVSGRTVYSKYSIKYYGMLTFMTNASIAYVDVKHESTFEGVEYHGKVTDSHEYTL